MKRSLQEEKESTVDVVSQVFQLRELCCYILLSQLEMNWFGRRELARMSQCRDLCHQREVSHFFLDVVDNCVRQQIEEISLEVSHQIPKEIFLSHSKGLTFLQPCRKMLFGEEEKLATLCIHSIDNHLRKDEIRRMKNLTFLNLDHTNYSDNPLFPLPLPKLRSLAIGSIYINNTDLRSLTALTNLSIVSCNYITDTILSLFTNLTILGLGSNAIITDQSISNLTRLTRLDIGKTECITDTSLSLLTNLNQLCIMKGNTCVSDLTLMRFTKLEILSIIGQSPITNPTIAKLPNLNHLYLEGRGFSIKILSNMTDLVYFKIDNPDSALFPEEEEEIYLPRLVKLDYFSAPNCYAFTNQSFHNLTNLTYLCLSNTNATTCSISHLTSRLRFLDVVDNPDFAYDQLSQFTQLKELGFSDSEANVHCLQHLTNLNFLYCSYNGHLNESHLSSLSRLTRLDITNFELGESLKEFARARDITLKICKS